MPNCHVCPVSHECEDANTYMDLVYHEKFDRCVLVQNLKYMMDSYISVGLGDPRGYKQNLPRISTQKSSLQEVSTSQQQQ